MTADVPPDDPFGPTRDLPGHERSGRDSGNAAPDASAATQDFARAGGSAAVLNPAALRPGDVFAGRYEIVSSVARGGFSYVFRAVDRSGGGSVALKFLSARDAGADLENRMQRELRLARDLRHPNIVRVFDLVEAEGFLCLTMEFVEGETLKELVRARHPVGVGEAVGILSRLASAMAAVHAAGVVHRDLKPQNVIVAAGGEVKLLDFGLARTPDSTGLTVTGTILGTPEYMSPEQVDGKVADSRSDVYSLGVIGFELLAGSPPFRGDNALAVALQHVRSRVPDVRRLRPETPEAIARLLQRMTEPDRAKRPQSAGDVLLELEQGSRVRRRRGARRRTLVAAGALAAAACGVAVAVAVGKGRGGGGPENDPFRDGVVDVAVALADTPDAFGAASFAKALSELVSSRLASSVTRVHALSAEEARSSLRAPGALRGAGVEQLLVIGISRVPTGEGEGPAFTIAATVRNTTDGAAWRELPPQRFGAFDVEAVDGASQRIAREYIDAVSAAAKSASRR
jgi:predicted Ser/Thr protein kinase